MDVQEAVAMFDSGLGVAAIARELGVTTQTIRRALKDAGKLVNPKATVDEEAIAQAYSEGKAVPEILAVYSITYATLYKILSDHNIATRKVSEATVTNLRLDRAVELYQAGVPLWSIKQETGIAQPTLHAALHQRGITLRRPRML